MLAFAEGIAIEDATAKSETSDATSFVDTFMS
jgi:hypothetical protein